MLNEHNQRHQPEQVTDEDGEPLSEELLKARRWGQHLRKVCILAEGLNTPIPFFLALPDNELDEYVQVYNQIQQEKEEEAKRAVTSKNQRG